MARALKPKPEYEVLEGALSADAWATPVLALQLTPEPRDRVVRLVVTNPHFNTGYLRNKVRLAIDGETVFEDMMFAGHGLQVETPVAAREPVLIELASEVSLEPDPLDSRRRGVWLKLSHKAVDAK